MTHPAESTHWYNRNGEPVYTVKARDGRDRNTHLGDARKLGLVPSVTTIIRLAAAPGLEIWKQEQMMLAALTLPRRDGEEETAWVERVRADSKQQTRDAAERGTRIHAEVQDAVETGFLYSVSGDAVVRVLRELPNSGSWRCEESFAHPLGFGGKTDIFNDFYVIDFKTKEFYEPSVRGFGYDEHCLQLAAYRAGLGIPDAACANLFISTVVPGLVQWQWWTPEELDRGWKMFTALLAYWKAKTGFDTSW